jgi:hypothetical protein
METDNYKLKYLKYKEKYINLKNSIQNGGEYKNNNQNDKAIVLLTVVPNVKQMDLWAELYVKNMDILIVCDNNDADLSDFREKYPSFKFIQVNNDECVKAGYQNMNYLIRPGFPTAWEKAVYFLCEKSDYKYAWLLEDDVVIPHPKTIYILDNKLGNKPDLAVSFKHYYYNENYWAHWKTLPNFFTKKNNAYGIDKKSKKPFVGVKGMVCASRVSRNLLNAIKKFAHDNNTLFFLELLFNSLAEKYRLKVVMPIELSNIIWRKEYKISEMNKKYLYHPIKNIEEQVEIRKYFTK